MERFVVSLGDIKLCRADALVHPVTEQLTAAGVVSEEIFRAADGELPKELATLAPCKPGGVVVTQGHGLPVRWLLHTVSPRWQGGEQGEEQILSDCYRNCLEKAAELGCETVAFPSISTGAYHFPVNLAAAAAVRSIQSFLKKNQSLKQVTLVCLDQRSTLVYEMCAAQARMAGR